jgi:hypothetical protein
VEKRTKNWLLIGCGGAIFLVMAGVAVVGGFGYYVYQQFNLNTAHVQPADAAKQLDEIRAKFPGEPKLTFSKRPDGQADVKVAAPATSTTSLTALHVAAFDPSENKLVQVTVPFWLLRMAPSGKMKVNGDEILNHLQTPSGHLTPKDIEALGPGLLVDHVEADGSRVVIWSE